MCAGDMYFCFLRKAENRNNGDERMTGETEDGEKERGGD